MKTATTTVYDAQREHWESTYRNKPMMFGQEPSAAARAAAELFRSEGVRSVLELGAGHGRDTLHFAGQGFGVAALEYSRQGVAIIEERAKDVGLGAVKIICHDVRRPLPLPSDSFDACYSHMLFCMALSDAELDALAAEVRRVLRPGGLHVYTVRTTGDPEYGSGTRVGPDTYQNAGGYVVHYFSMETVRRVASEYELVSVDEFEEGTLPKRLFRVTMRKVQLARKTTRCSKEEGTDQQIRSRLTDEEIAKLDPYALMAVLGKRVIHPGGRRSTEELFQLAEFQPDQRVLEVGCGVGTTAVEIARRYGCHVTAVDVDPLMLVRAEAAVCQTGVGRRVQVEKADIQSLPFADSSFDRVVIEAVTIFVDRPRAVREVIRVCRPGGRVLEHEFIYRTPPTPEIRHTIEGEVCGGVRFDTAEEWIDLYEAAGLRNIQVRVGPFAMMTPKGMLRDEGLANTLRMMLRILGRRAYRRKMSWLMSRMLRAMPYLGYVVLVGAKDTAVKGGIRE